MIRRQFITLLGGAAAWPLAARGQKSEQMRRIGMLEGFAESNREGQERASAFLEGLKQLGWIEGRNIRIDIRWAAPGDATAVSLMARMSESNTAGRPGNTINSRGWQKNLLGCRFRCWRRAGVNWRPRPRPPRLETGGWLLVAP